MLTDILMIVLNYDVRRLTTHYCLHMQCNHYVHIVVVEACITMALLYPA